jgi:hypothetical protein
VASGSADFDQSPGFDSPKTALQTFFASIVERDKDKYKSMTAAVRFEDLEPYLNSYIQPGLFTMRGRQN